MSPMPSAEDCPGIDTAGLLATHLTPFVSAKGKVYSACDAAHMPPEAAVDSAFPPAEIAAFTDADGNGSVQFEVRTDVENESLGCNHKTACSIVVDPDRRHQLRPGVDAPRHDLTPVEKACRKTGQFAPGSQQLRRRRPTQAVSPVLLVVRVQLAQPVRRSRSPSVCRRTPATSSTRGRRPASTAPSCSPRPRCSGRRRTA